MDDSFIQTRPEAFHSSAKPVVSLLAASRPYITVVVIMTILLSVWAGLCAA